MGGGGTSYGDNTGLWMQHLQANDARQREELRQQRITEGRGVIDRNFSQLMDPNDTFYQRYKSAGRDAYMPQVQKQYADANKELTYRLADAGTLRSGMAAEAAADLAGQNDAAIAGLNSKLDNAAADLRTRVASEKQNAENQLYATHDPDMALTSSLNSIQNMHMASPDLSAQMGQMFNIGAMGLGNALKAMQSGGSGGGFSGFGTSSNAPSISKGAGNFIGG